MTTFLQRKDGSRYPVELHVQRARFESKPVLLAFAMDVTASQSTVQRMKARNAVLK